MPGGIKKNKKGFTLLEILVSIGILSIIIAPLLSMFLNAYKNTVFSQQIMSGTYISQAVLENCKNLDYVSIVSQSAAATSYDSDGDGSGDCYVKIEKHPEGVPGGISLSEKASFIHIIYIGDTVHVLGDDGSYASFTAQSDASYRLDHATGNTLMLVDNSDDTILAQFTVKSIAYPLIIIVNLAQKTFGYSNTLALSSYVTSNYTATVVEYSTENNRDELVCSQLLAANRFYGVNDYATALLHMNISVYSDSACTKKMGAIEETIMVPVR